MTPKTRFIPLGLGYRIECHVADGTHLPPTLLGMVLRETSAACLLCSTCEQPAQTRPQVTFQVMSRITNNWNSRAQWDRVTQALAAVEESEADFGRPIGNHYKLQLVLYELDYV